MTQLQTCQDISAQPNWQTEEVEATKRPMVFDILEDQKRSNHHKHFPERMNFKKPISKNDLHKISLPFNT